MRADGFWQSDLNFQAKAIEALQHAAEEYIARLFDDVSLFRVCWTSAVAYLLPQTNMEAMHAKRCTVFPQDMKVWQLYCTATPWHSHHTAADGAAYQGGAILKPPLRNCIFIKPLLSRETSAPRESAL